MSGIWRVLLAAALGCIAALAQAEPSPLLQVLAAQVERHGERVVREDVGFDSGGVRLRGWLYRPRQADAALPAIAMLAGLSAAKEQTYPWFATEFAAAGHAVLLYDQPGFGSSDGQPRLEADPWQQVRAARDALSFLASHPAIDARRLGLWGGSYGGGHALVVAAVDRRVRCVVVAMTPFPGSGGQPGPGVARAHAQLQPLFQADRAHRFNGGAPRMIPVVSDRPGDLVAVPGAEPWRFLQDIAPLSTAHVNQVTLRTLEMVLEYEPGAYVSRIAPTPLLMLLAEGDRQVDNALLRQVFARAGEPKALKTLDGHHFSPYLERFTDAVAEALGWFGRHL